MRRRLLMLSASCAAVLCTGLFGQAADSNSLRLVSVADPSPGLSCRSGAGGSFMPSLSADGRWVVFLSQAHNLVTNDSPTPHLNVFARELATGKTTLVSVSSSGVGGGNDNANFACISSNGQFIAFASWAGNLANNDTNGRSDVFVRDLTAATTTLVSVDTNGVAAALGSGNPLISADGRWVFFQSQALNLVSLPSGFPALDVFARDLLSNRTHLVSDSVNRTGGSGSGTSYSELSSITPDGRFVAFINTTVASPTQQVYVRDMQSGLTQQASEGVATNFDGRYYCYSAALSAEGRCVAFRAKAEACCSSSVFLFQYDLQTRTTTVISSNTASYGWPEVSPDGRFVAYDDGTNVFAWDAQLQTNILVSVNRAGTGPGNGPSSTPAMTPDGRYVAFLSAATDLTTNASNGLFLVYVRDLVAGTTRLVSANRDGLASSSDLELTTPAISADGRLVAFDSMADDLVAGDSNQASDVFVRDLNTDITQLVSERDPTLPAVSSPVFSSVANSSCISSNARWVTFSSPGGNLVPGDTNGWPDVFVRDLVTGSLQCVGLDTNGTGESVVSADGRFVAYTRRTTGEVYSAFGAGNIYRYDVQAGANVLVSVNTNGGPAGLSSLPTISPDGRFVAFQSRAGGLIPQGTPAKLQIFLRDLDLGTNILVSVNTNGTFGNNDSRSPLFSPDGRWLMFRSSAEKLVTNPVSTILIDGALYAHDLSLNRLVLVSSMPPGPAQKLLSPAFSPDSRWVVFATDRGTIWVRDLLNSTTAVSVASGSLRSPAMSSGGRYVVYEQWPPAGVVVRQIMLLDRQTGVTNLISVNRTGTGGGNNASSSPYITPDGQFVVFASKASDLVDDDTNGVSDIFVRDRLQNVTLLVSVNGLGLSGNNASATPVLGPDGRTVVFQSFAANLADGDYNATRDVFVLRLSAGDHDGDGLDDDWEMAYFNALARDGTGDFDGDRLSDLQEFLAGTDPTNTGSVLRVMALTQLSGGQTRLLWQATPGRLYKVQRKDNLHDSAWIEVPGMVTIAGGTASLVDDTSGSQPHRFYRLVLQ